MAEVTFSTPIIRSDNGIATLTVKSLCYHLIDWHIDILDTGKHFGRKRLHLDKESEFTCSKLTIETIEQGVKYVQSQQ